MNLSELREYSFIRSKRLLHRKDYDIFRGNNKSTRVWERVM